MGPAASLTLPNSTGKRTSTMRFVYSITSVSITRHIVGYSRGAAIASRIVAQRPRRARSVVFGGWGTDNPVQKLDPSECESTAAALERGEPPIMLLRALETP